MEPTKQISIWWLKCVLLGLVFMVQNATALVTSGDLPQEIQDCYNRYGHTSLRDVVGQSVCWECEAPTIRRLRTSFPPSMETASSIRYMNALLEKAKNLNGKRSRSKGKTTPKCRRKEYRTLSDEERQRFHTALNALKRNTTVSPNKYDALAILHSGDVIPAAHGGPNFLGWHRVYLLLMESELQEVDPKVCLPYWDSSLDNELDDPSSSHIFSPEFLGGRGSNGPVVDGPFAGWVTPNFGPLMRDIGTTGQLYNITAINNILSQRRTADITPPNGLPQNGLEFHHNGVHVFIGGQMNSLQASAHDPIFFLHHAFVDYLWEEFRTKQRESGIDHQSDYPEDFGSPLHNPNNPIGFNWSITALQGYNDNLTSTYEYEPTPTCSRQRPTCGSKYLQCNVQRGRCTPIEPATTTPQPDCQKRCSPKSKYCMRYPLGIQNSYCIDGVCDTKGWVYIPVEVVSVRSPELMKFESYPVHNGSIDHVHDIYQASAYPDINRYIPRREPKGYEKCVDGHGIGQVYVQSNGLSYEGFYKESAIIDQRLATSLAIAYVAVKDPKNGPVKALFRAFDSCGRICHTSCRMPGTNENRPCSGVLDIEDVPGRPKQYSQTYGEATLNTWGYSRNQNCPRFRDNDIILTFYCDYREEIPWMRKPQPSPANECRIDAECTIDVSCETATSSCFGQRYKCRGKCGKYAECSYGKYVKKSCPYNGSFDNIGRGCNRRRQCPSSAAAPYPPRYQYRTWF